MSADGRRYSALPPFQIDGKATARIATLYTPIGFGYAPYMSA
jgi:hypothetical protein